MKDNCPLVSISCITYNHAPYIRQCLDGFMMQQTNFAFEVLIHDDASTDGTTEIIKEYEEKYPDIIKPLYEEENQWVKGRRGSAVFNFPRAKGKYIALCEGDDYWIDPLKLQKQVDFLEANPDFVMCSHLSKMYLQNDNILKDDWHGHLLNGIIYDLDKLIHGWWDFQTATVMFCAKQLDQRLYSRYPYPVDAVLFFHVLKKGNGYVMPQEMAVYRVHAGGGWANLNYNSQTKQDFLTRIGLYEVEQSYEAAFYLRHQLAKPMSRLLMIQEWKLMIKSFKIISKHFGFFSTFKTFFLKLFLNRTLKYSI